MRYEMSGKASGLMRLQTEVVGRGTSEITRWDCTGAAVEATEAGAGARQPWIRTGNGRLSAALAEAFAAAAGPSLARVLDCETAAL
jgi:hypothetical protein